jgi:hypothetical protein
VTLLAERHRRLQKIVLSETVLFLSSLGTFFWCFDSLMGARDLVHFERFSKSFAAFSTWF